MTEQFLTLKEVAERLKFTTRRIMDLWREGKFPHAVGDDPDTIRFSVSDLDNLGKAETKPEISTMDLDVKKAQDEANIAEQRRKKAEAEAAEALAIRNRDANSQGMTLEQYLTAQAEFLKKVAEKETELAEKEEKFKTEYTEKFMILESKEEAYLQTILRKNDLIKDLELKNKEQQKEIEKLSALLGDLEQREVEKENTLDHYLKHINEALDSLTSLRNYVKDLDIQGQKLAGYLTERINWMSTDLKKTDPPSGTYKNNNRLLRACIKAIIGLAQFYQDGYRYSRGNTRKQFDPIKVSNYLCKVTDYLENLMQLDDLKLKA